MLIPGTIPDSEPVLRVGIVLPEDRKKQINFFGRGKSTVIADDKYFYVDSISFGIEATKENLSFIYRGVKINAKFISVTPENESDHTEVWPITAGRGFHWQKEITVKLVSKLEFSLSDGFILMINELPFEKYLACVATSEMSAACPNAMIEAQTIVARSWMLANVERKHVHLGFDVCNDDCCQRFQGITNLTDHAVGATGKTKGIVLMYENEICDARYSKSCGGVMEKFENLWDGDALPYMQNLADAKNMSVPDLTREDIFANWIHDMPEVFCSEHFVHAHELSQYLGNVDESGQYFRWTMELSQETLTRHLNQKLKINAIYIQSMKPVSRAGSGRMMELSIEYLDHSNAFKQISVYRDYHIREVLHPDFLYSSACLIEISEVKNGKPSKFKYTGGGWGHGAGLCQIGALGMSLQGYRVEDILFHYYPGSKLITLY